MSNTNSPADCLKRAWQTTQDEQIEAVKIGDWAGAQLAKGALAGILRVASELGYEVSVTKKDDNEKERAGESDSKSKRRTKTKSGKKNTP